MTRRLAALTALLVLTASAQAVAPASAGAVADQVGKCENVKIPGAGLVPGMGWNGSFACVLPGPNGDGVGKTYNVNGLTKTQPVPFDPCSPAYLCMPSQVGPRGGRSLGPGEDGFNVRRGRSGAASKRGEALRKKLSKDKKKRKKPDRGHGATEPEDWKVPSFLDCQFFQDHIIISESDNERYDRFEELAAGMRETLRKFAGDRVELQRGLERITDKLDKLKANRPADGGEIGRLMADRADALNDIVAMEEKQTFLRVRIRTMESEMQQMWERGNSAAEGFLEICGQIYSFDPNG